MVQLRLELRSVRDQIRLTGTRVEWPDRVIQASQSNWGRRARTEILVLFFARYKLWAVEGKPDRFVLAGARGSAANALNYLLENAHRHNHWARTVFGAQPRDPRFCRLKEVLLVPERGGTFFAEVKSETLPAARVEILLDGVELRSAEQLRGLLATLESGTKERLTGHLDVLIWDPTGKRPSGVSIHEPGALPAHVGDLVRVRLRFNLPAFVYLAWRTSNGMVHPVYPWEEAQWCRFPEREKCVVELDLPIPSQAASLLGWPLKSPAGVETLIAMACQDPLPAGFDLEILLSELPAPIQGSDKEAVVFGASPQESVRLSSGLGQYLSRATFFQAPDLANPQPLPDDRSQVLDFVHDQLAPYFDLVLGTSFVSKLR